MAQLSRRHLLHSALVTSAVALVPSAALARSCEGVSFPESKSVAGKTLKLNGIGLREATFLKVDVYVAGLYAERPSKSAAALLKFDQVEHISLRLIRDVDAESMNEAIEEGFKKNAGSQYGAMKPRIEQLRKGIPNLKKGNRFEFTWIPGTGTVMTHNGTKKATIKGDDFAKVMLKIWLGPTPADAGLKKGLLGGPC